jgi:hypothetical protein
MSGSGYWNRQKQPQMPGWRGPRSFTKEQRDACLSDVYGKVKAKRPDLTPEQFIEELQEGKIQISIEGQIVKFEDL